MIDELLTVRHVADRCGVRPWQVLDLAHRRLMPPPRRVGNMRLIPLDEVPLVEAALRAAGHLK